MKRETILYTSADLHKAIRDILGSPAPSGRRVVLVAFLGSGANRYLPHPSGLEIVCNPQPGSTDPDAVRWFLKKKARVRFSPRLHMKVYWSKNRGCVIGSANASSAALGRGGLREAGVFVPSASVDIDRLLRYASPQEIRKAQMDELDRGKEKKRSKRKKPKEASPDRGRDSYLDWYRSPYRQAWTLISVSGSNLKLARDAKDKANVEYGSRNVEMYTNVSSKELKQNSWILQFYADKLRSIGPIWIYAQFLVRVHRTEKGYDKDYPYQAVQVHPLRECPDPPFPITPAFRNAFVKAAKSIGPENLVGLKTGKPPKRLLDKIALEMQIRKKSGRISR